MPESLILRDRIFTPQSAIGGVIAIYHPGYPKDKGFLIGFVGYDTTNGGIWREVVTTACAILSNNRFDGWLAKDNIKNSQSIQSELLDAGDYYWHVQNETDKPYGILPIFRNWRFPPPELIPKSWSTNRKTIERGNRCYVTQQRSGVELAHIVPQSETEWFNINSLVQHAGGFPKFTGNTYSVGIDSPYNTMPLRTDLHRLLDQKHLTFIPKRGKDGDTIVAHCLEDPEIASLYHNVPIHGYLQKELLLARFGWALFPLGTSRFLQMGVPRVLWVADEQGNVQEKEVSPQQCQKYALLRSQSSSPKKRAKSRDDNAKDADLVDLSERWSKRSFDSGVGLSDTESLLQPSEYYEEPRGRKRHRIWEERLAM